jgi:hypothetical protein
MIEALSSSETSVFTRGARRNIPKDGILDSNSCLYDQTFLTILWNLAVYNL